MPGPQPLNIFIVAEQFRFAGKLATLAPHLIDRYPEFDFVRGQIMPISSMVCAAFSLELYLKCLIRLGRRSYEPIHDLEKLFSLNGLENQIEIKRHWYKNSSGVVADVEEFCREEGAAIPKIDFNYCLSASKNAFGVMRYVFEKGVAPHRGWLGDTIVESARYVILERHPDWENMRQASLLPKTSFRPTSLIR